MNASVSAIAQQDKTQVLFKVSRWRSFWTRFRAKRIFYRHYNKSYAMEAMRFMMKDPHIDKRTRAMCEAYYNILRS